MTGNEPQDDQHLDDDEFRTVNLNADDSDAPENAARDEVDDSGAQETVQLSADQLAEHQAESPPVDHDSLSTVDLRENSESQAPIAAAASGEDSMETVDLSGDLQAAAAVDSPQQNFDEAADDDEFQTMQMSDQPGYPDQENIETQYEMPPESPAEKAPDPFATEMLQPAVSDDEITDPNATAVLSDPDPRETRELSTIPSDSPEAQEMMTMAAGMAGSQAEDDFGELVSGPVSGQDADEEGLHVRHHVFTGMPEAERNALPAALNRPPEFLQRALQRGERQPEYRVTRELGKGGMGIVYSTIQTSLDRELAIKTLNNKKQGSQGAFIAETFATEAILTANLVHPNIIPIHDLGCDPEGRLFYSMKQVEGDAWHKTMSQMNLDDNLDILLKVCDAVAYAHSRGIINRDLKPENVVIGGFGEVVVLDWGLAITTPRFQRRDWLKLNQQGGCGTPAYMAPELANPDIRKVSERTDIYLLGAMLFELLEGFAPHMLKALKTVGDPKERFRMVVQAVVQNQIEPDVRNHGELMNVAMQAMATDPQDRYATVEEFQEAIREYRITGRAEELLKRAKAGKTPGYGDFQASVALFEDALQRRADNQRATRGNLSARLAFSELALKRGDYDLGLEVVKGMEEASPELTNATTRLINARRTRKVIRTTWMITLVASVLFAFLSAYQAQKLKENYDQLVLAQGDRDNALKETARAQEELQIAERSKREAESDAKVAFQNAETARRKAEDATTQLQETTQTLALTETQLSEKNAEVEQAKTDLLAADEALTTARENLATAKKDQQEAEENLALAETQLEQSQEKLDLSRKDLEQSRKSLASSQENLVQSQQDLVRSKQDLNQSQRELSVRKQELNRAEVVRYQQQIQTQLLLRQYSEVLVTGKDALQQLADNPELTDNERTAIERQISRAQRNQGHSQLRLKGSASVAAISSDGAVLLRLLNSPDSTKQFVQLTETDADGNHKDSVSLSLPPALLVRQLASSDDGTVVCGLGNGLAVWKKITPQEYAAIDLGQLSDDIASLTGGIRKCLFSADSQRLYVLGDDPDCTLIIVDISGQTPTVLLNETLYPAGTANFRCQDAVLTPDESWLIFAARRQDNQCRAFRLLESETGISLAERGFQALTIRAAQNSDVIRLCTQSRIASLNLSPSGDRLVIGLETSGQSSLLVLNAVPEADAATFPFDGPDSGQPLNRVFSVTGELPKPVCLSADSSFLAGGLPSTQNDLQLWQFDPQTDQLTSADRNLLTGLWTPAGITDNADERLQPSLLSGQNGQLLAVTFAGPSNRTLYAVSRQPLENLRGGWNLPQIGSWQQDLRGLEDIFEKVIQRHAAEVKQAAPQASAVRQPDRRSPGALPETVLTGYVPCRLPTAEPTARVPFEVLRIAPNHAAWKAVYSAEFSTDGSRILIGADDLSAHIFDARTIAPLQSSGGRSSAIRGASEATATDNAGVFFEGHTSEVSSCRFVGQDGNLLLSAETFGVISCWDAADDADGAGREVSRMLTGISSADFVVSNDQNWIFAAGARINPDKDNVAEPLLYDGMLWRVADLTSQLTPQPERVFSGQHAGAEITAVAISPNNAMVLTAGRRGEINLWSTADGRQIAQSRGSHDGDGVSSAIFTSDNSFMTAGYDGRVIVWNLEDNKLKQKTLFQGEMIIRMKASPAGDLLSLVQIRTEDEQNLLEVVVLSTTGTVEATLLSRRFRSTERRLPMQTDCCWTDDATGQLLVVFDGKLLIYDRTSWQRVAIRRPASTEPESARQLLPLRTAFQPPGKGHARVATLNGRQLQMWDWKTGQHLCSFRSHHQQQIVASLSSDNQYILTGSETLRIFDAAEKSALQGQTLLRIPQRDSHSAPVSSVEFSPVAGDYRFASADHSGEIRIWNWNRKDLPPPPLRILPVRQQTLPTWAQSELIQRFPSTVKWHRDGQFLAGLQNGTASCWRLNHQQADTIPLPLPDGLDSTTIRFSSLRFVAAGNLLIAGGLCSSDEAVLQSVVCVWEIGEHATLRSTLRDSTQHSTEASPAGFPGGITAVDFDPQQQMLLTGGVDGRINEWVLNLDQQQDQRDQPAAWVSRLEAPGQQNHLNRLLSISFGKQGQILTADAAGTCLIWNVRRP